MFHVPGIYQSHIRGRHFKPLSGQLILCTACELILSESRIIFIHCQGINFVSKARGMTISSNLLLGNEVKGVLQVPRHRQIRNNNKVENLYP